MIDPLVRLAANAEPGSKRFVLLAGAGVSRDSGHPTAWDLLLATAEHLRAAEDSGSTTPIAEWFQASRYAAMPYAAMIEAVHPHAGEQRAFLDKHLPHRPPGRAQHLIAELAKRGILKAVVTPNFDDLLELGAAAANLPYEVIDNERGFADCTPLAHASRLRVYHPHGKLGGLLRNTPREVEELPAPIASELTRVFEDHAVIVLGYGGNEAGLMKALAARRRNIYPVYWLHKEDVLPPPAAVLGEQVVAIPIPAGAGAALQTVLQIQDGLARRIAARGRLDSGPALEAIAAARKDVAARVRSFCRDHEAAVRALAPRPEEMDLHAHPEADDDFLKALHAAEPLTAAFLEVARASAEHGSVAATTALREHCQQLMPRMCPRGERGATIRDYPQFLAQEMFGGLVALLVREERWDVLKSTLTHSVVGPEGDLAHWTELNAYITTLDEHRTRRLNSGRFTLAGDEYRSRFGRAPINEVCTLHELENADWLLAFATFYHAEPPGGHDVQAWYPRMTIQSRHTPPWLAKMRSRSFAEPLLEIMMPGTALGPRAERFAAHIEGACGLARTLWRSRGIAHALAQSQQRTLRDELFSLP